MRVKLFDSFLSKAKDYEIFKMTWLKVIMVFLGLFGVRFFLVDDPVNPALMYLNLDLQIIFVIFTVAMLLSCVGSIVDLNEHVSRLSQKCQDVLVALFRQNDQHRVNKRIGAPAHHGVRYPVSRRGGKFEVLQRVAPETYTPDESISSRSSAARHATPCDPSHPVATQNNTIVILDGDPMLTDAWQLRGKMRGVRVIALNSMATFKSILLDLHPEMPIYIDYHHQEEMTGIALAKQLAIFGFKNLYLCSAHDPRTLASMPWIKQVVGKAPLF